MATTTPTATLATAQPARHRQPTVKAQALAHLIFERPDLQQAERFLADFGLQPAGKDATTLYLRGTGPAPTATGYTWPNARAFSVSA